MQPSLQYFPQDNNLVLLTQQAVTGNVNGNIFDLNVANGMFEGRIVVEVGTPTGTSPSLDVELHQSSDKFASNDVTQPLMLKGITAAGTYFIPFDNRVVTSRGFRPVFKATGTTPSFPVRCYIAPDED